MQPPITTPRSDRDKFGYGKTKKQVNPFIIPLSFLIGQILVSNLQNQAQGINISPCRILNNPNAN